MAAGVADLFDAVDAAVDVEVGEAEAVLDAVVVEAAGDFGEAAEDAQAAAFAGEFAVGAAAALVSDQVDDAGGGVCSVGGRAEAAEDFDAVRVDELEVSQVGGGVALDGGDVAEAHAVQQDTGVGGAQAAGEDAG